MFYSQSALNPRSLFFVADEELQGTICGVLQHLPMTRPRAQVWLRELQTRSPLLLKA